MSGTALGGPGARPAHLPSQLVPSVVEPTLQAQVHEAYHKDVTPISLPSTVDIARSPRGGRKVEGRHGEYNRGKGAGENCDGPKVPDERKMIPMNRETCCDESDNAGDDSVARRKTRRKEGRRRKPANPGGGLVE